MTVWKYTVKQKLLPVYAPPNAPKWTLHLCSSFNLNCNYSAHVSFPLRWRNSSLALFLFFFVIWAKLQLPHIGLRCSEPSLRKLSPQLPPNLFSSPPPASTALFHLTAILGQRSLLLLLHALSRTLNSCITNPFPIRLANMFEILFLSLSASAYFYLTLDSPS